jgi:6-phosphogluconolactonase
MKFGKVGQVGLVFALALIVSTLFTACATLTVGFLFVPTNRLSPGSIEVFEVNSLSGVLRTIPTSPFPSGGRNPIAEAVGPDAKNLFVVNGDDNNIVQFAIGTDGKLYPQSTLNTPGSFPMAVAVNSGNTFAYVVDTLEPIPGCSISNPCSGDIATYAVTPSTSTILPGSFGLAPSQCSQNPLPSGFDSSQCAVGDAIVNSNGLAYIPLPVNPVTGDILTPTALQVSNNGSYVYVSAYDSVASVGYIVAYSVSSTGALTPLNNGVPLPVGTDPVAMASDSGSNYLYVADKVTNKIYTLSIGAGVPTMLATAATGGSPSAMAIYNDQFLYAASSLDSTVTAYTISSGSLSKIGTYASDINPVGITVDPGNIGFLYTVNFLGSSLSGYQIDSSTGALINTQQTPYRSTAQPTAITGIPHAGQVR